MKTFKEFSKDVDIKDFEEYLIGTEPKEYDTSYSFKEEEDNKDKEEKK